MATDGGFSGRMLEKLCPTAMAIEVTERWPALVGTSKDAIKT
jgi:hypothetical protein